MRVTAVVNQKGGAGKATTAVSVAAAWADSGRRVLLVDLDPQASASRWLGDGRLDDGLLEVFDGDVGLHELAGPSGHPGVRLVRASPNLVDTRIVHTVAPHEAIRGRSAGSTASRRWCSTARRRWGMWWCRR